MRRRVPNTPRWRLPFAGCAVLAIAATLLAQQPAPAPQPPAPQQQQTAPPATPDQQQPAPVQQAPSQSAQQQPATAPQQSAPDQQPSAQQPAQPTAPAAAQPENQQQPAGTTPVPAAQPTTPTPPPAPVTKSDAPATSEDEMRQQFAGKTFYIRGGYLDNSLHFNDRGQLDGSSPKASYTLSLVQIDRVHLDKHHLELEGVRYGLHFLGAAPYEEQAVDRVRLTSKKKPLRITIDREEVVAPKKEKPAKEDKKHKQQAPAPAKAATTGSTQPASQSSQPAASGPEATSTSSAAAAPADANASQPGSAPAQATAQSGEPEASSEEAPAASASSQAPAALQSPPAVASAPQAEPERHGFTVTTSQAHANQALRQALDTIFASAVDPRMIGTLPDYWQLYYKDVDAKQDYRPGDASILRQSQVDKKAHLVSAFDPPSNEYAQNNGVAGMSMYHVVVEPNGTAGEIAIGRPIGFGLDESAIDAIRKAKFEPAIKGGAPVPVVLDVVVQFRIYSKRTNVASAAPAAKSGEPQAPILPGPYTANERKPPAQPQPQ